MTLLSLSTKYLPLTNTSEGGVFDLGAPDESEISATASFLSANELALFSFTELKLFPQAVKIKVAAIAPGINDIFALISLSLPFKDDNLSPF
jgi:hypothetical protein